MCRQAGYFEHALYLSEKHRRHDWYLKIQLEDIKDFQEALSHISGLQFIEVGHSLFLSDFLFFKNSRVQNVLKILGNTTNIQ